MGQNAVLFIFVPSKIIANIIFRTCIALLCVIAKLGTFVYRFKIRIPSYIRDRVNSLVNFSWRTRKFWIFENVRLQTVLSFLPKQLSNNYYFGYFLFILVKWKHTAQKWTFEILWNRLTDFAQIFLSVILKSRDQYFSFTFPIKIWWRKLRIFSRLMVEIF